MNPTETPRIGRPAVSCSMCRKRKLRCDRAFPCSNCLRSRSRQPAEDCVYEDGDTSIRTSHSPATPISTSTSLQRPAKRRAPSPTPVEPHQQPSPVTVTSKPPTSSRPAEDQLSARSATPAFVQFHSLTSPPDSPEAPKSQSHEPLHIYCLVGHDFFGETYHVNRAVAHKSRVFGRSHWLALVEYFQDLVELIAPFLREDKAKCVVELKKCKQLAREIKAQRAPAWPTPVTTQLPPKELADELVDAYLRTTETLYRVLHVPSFKRDYESLWLQWPGHPPNKAFLVQLKLVLAIGAVTYDETFSLRPSAVRWVFEAQTYLSEPNTCKSRIGLQSLQTNVLLLIAQEATGIDADSLWISAGSLLRSAMSIGLHKDPTSVLVGPVPRILGEMRRRLWNTVLEIAMQSSLDYGKPPLLSLDDFDTQCPSNLDDEQLMADGEDTPPRSDGGELTSMTIPIALRKTLPLRLAIAKMLNDSTRSPSTYEDTLKLDKDLRAMYKQTVQALQRPGLSPSPSRFDICALDVIIHRYLASLHVPYLGANLQETPSASAYSRKVALDSAIRIYAIGSSWAPTTTISSSTTTTFTRFTQASSGFLPYAVFQANLIVAIELKTQLREEPTLALAAGPTSSNPGGGGGVMMFLRPDLLALLEDSKTFSVRCIEAGETNIKGFMFRCLVSAQIEGLRRGLGQEELQRFVVGSAEEAISASRPLLERMLGAGSAKGGEVKGGDGDGDGDGGTGGQAGNLLGDTTVEDWNFLISDPLFTPVGGVTDLMNWMVADDLIHDMSY